MKKLFWKAVLYMLRQISSTDINEQLLRENEYLHVGGAVETGSLVGGSKCSTTHHHHGGNRPDVGIFYRI